MQINQGLLHNGFIVQGSIFDAMSDKEFEELCLSNDFLNIERYPDGKLYFMSPTTSLTGRYNSRIIGILEIWNMKHNMGYVFDSSSGFTVFPNNKKSTLSPDACWIKKERFDALSFEEQYSFAPICPDFIVELVSKSDSIDFVRNKMNIWIESGCQLAWLIDCDNEFVEIYKPNSEIKTVNGFNKTLNGEHVLNEFSLDLSLIKG